MRYANANSPCSIDPPCVIKNATAIVKIIGISTKRLNMPRIRATEHTNSAKIARINDVCEPTPNGSGKALDI